MSHSYPAEREKSRKYRARATCSESGRLDVSARKILPPGELWRQHPGLITQAEGSRVSALAELRRTEQAHLCHYSV